MIVTIGAERETRSRSWSGRALNRTKDDRRLRTEGELGGDTRAEVAGFLGALLPAAGGDP